jgi:NTP pyrophosphatase (non-canonical NTP hydrolase)
MANNLTFDNFSFLNEKRCNESFHHLAGYDPTLLLAGACEELGEVAKEIKHEYDNDLLPELVAERIGEEVADCITYLDLICTKYGLKLSDVLARKFNAVSDRRNSTIKIPV